VAPRSCAQQLHTRSAGRRCGGCAGRFYRSERVSVCLLCLHWPPCFYTELNGRRQAGQQAATRRCRCFPCRPMGVQRAAIGSVLPLRSACALGVRTMPSAASPSVTRPNPAAAAPTAERRRACALQGGRIAHRAQRQRRGFGNKGT